MKVQVGVSVRHMHITKEDLEYLFRKGYVLKPLRPLVQTGEYASTDVVTIKGEKGSIEKVRIIGPVRDYTQVEVSKTDAYKLGINPPIRNSGDLEGGASIIICNKDLELKKESSCIIPNRHLHMSMRDLFKLGFENNEVVKVKIKGEKGGILDNVYIKAQDDYVLELHLDTDDANAHLVHTGDICEVVKDE
jgi:putative phosphotransacetylase